MRKPAFCVCENKDADQLAVTAKLISAFIFATRIVQSLFLLNPKFHASSHLLWLYRTVCVGPGQKPRRPVFSERGSSKCTPEICGRYTSILILSALQFTLISDLFLQIQQKKCQYFQIIKLRPTWLSSLAQ